MSADRSVSLVGGATELLAQEDGNRLQRLPNRSAGYAGAVEAWFSTETRLAILSTARARFGLIALSGGTEGVQAHNRLELTRDDIE